MYLWFLLSPIELFQTRNKNRRGHKQNRATKGLSKSGSTKAFENIDWFKKKVNTKKDIKAAKIGGIYIDVL
jgi:hypothetical protein